MTHKTPAKNYYVLLHLDASIFEKNTLVEKTKSTSTNTWLSSLYKWNVFCKGAEPVIEEDWSKAVSEFFLFQC